MTFLNFSKINRESQAKNTFFNSLRFLFTEISLFRLVAYSFRNLHKFLHLGRLRFMLSIETRFFEKAWFLCIRTTLIASPC